MQLHAITGTPCEVPVPKKVIFKIELFVQQKYYFPMRLKRKTTNFIAEIDGFLD
jgi:hypothetical protein